MNVVIFDDNSDDTQTIALLSSLKEKGVYVHDKRGGGESKHGGLYSMMNTAIAYAQDNNYKYAYFVQDDMQFLWRDEKLADKVHAVFSKEDCLMCNFCFLQKILDKGIADRLPKVGQEQLYTFHGNGVADTGIIAVEKAKKASLSFPKESERGNGTYWYEKGYRLYWLTTPHLAWVPWPTTYRHKAIERRNTNVLQVLNEQAIGRLKDNDSYAYLEDYTATTNWLLKPYWYAANPGKINLLKIYVKYYLRRIIK